MKVTNSKVVFLNPAKERLIIQFGCLLKPDARDEIQKQILEQYKDGVVVLPAYTTAVVVQNDSIVDCLFPEVEVKEKKMKTEYREVLVKQPVYIAEDGKEFEDEEDCQDYEFNQIRKTFECYDREFDSCDVDEAMFVNLPTKTIVENFKKVSGIMDMPIDGIDAPGLYIYTECQGGWWFNVDEAVARIRGGAKDD